MYPFLTFTSIFIYQRKNLLKNCKDYIFNSIKLRSDKNYTFPELEYLFNNMFILFYITFL